MITETLSALSSQLVTEQTSYLPVDPPPKAVRQASFIPIPPDTLAEAGLTEALLEQLILKILYYRNEVGGIELSIAIGLKFSVFEEVVDFLKRQHLIQVKRSLGIGPISAVYTLTENGRKYAREYLEANQYAGQAPVPLDQYVEGVAAQRQKADWLNMEMLERAFQHMVLTPEYLRQIGPAVNAGKSLLLYGQPGNGKTYLAESLFALDDEEIYIPYAIESQGMIIQMYDPVYHQVETPPEAAGGMFASTHTHDGRWFKCRRPFITSGGELDLSMLDLSFNPVSKFYDAPLQLKANNGIYLIDDFGRQKATPAEVLNRWIIPMERRIDYLSFVNGTKMTAPFEAFLVFSTNLQPESLGDEAFLRRIQYKMLMRNPDETEFRAIFDRFCTQKKLPYEPELLDDFIQNRYTESNKKKRRCHPRDVLTHAMDLIRFERRPWNLTKEILDYAFESCFSNHVED